MALRAKRKTRKKTSRPPHRRPRKKSPAAGTSAASFWSARIRQALKNKSPDPIVAAAKERQSRDSLSKIVQGILIAERGLNEGGKTSRKSPSQAKRFHADEARQLCDSAIVRLIENSEREWMSQHKSLRHARDIELARRALTMHVDSLTELHDHRYFYDRLQQELKRAIRYKDALSIMVCDIDGFRQIQAAVSHQAAEEAIRAVADILKNLTRDVDAVARTSGDEFAAIFPEVGADGAFIAAEKVRGAVETLTFPRSHPLHGMSFTISAGIAAYPRDGSTIETMLAAARDHLDEAKAAGRNQVIMGADLIA